MTALSRRTALTGALLAAVMPSEAEADPHPAWLDEWRTLDQRFTDAGSDEEARALVPRLNQLIELIVDTPARTPAGTIAKIQAIRGDTLVHLCEDVVAPSAIFDQVERFLGAL